MAKKSSNDQRTHHMGLSLLALAGNCLGGRKSSPMWWAFCMEKLQDYSKYYFLESYLFEEVGRSFRAQKQLTPFDFFSIAIWKANRNKGRIKKGIEEGESSVSKVSKILADVDPGSEESKREVLRKLIKAKIPGVGIPVASAFLSVLYPEVFTIVDDRTIYAFNHHEKLKLSDNEKLKPDPRTSTKGYFNYLNVCKRKSVELGFKDLREFDRALWGYSFFKELENYVRNLK